MRDVLNTQCTQQPASVHLRISLTSKIRWSWWHYSCKHLGTQRCEAIPVTSCPRNSSVYLGPQGLVRTLLFKHSDMIKCSKNVQNVLRFCLNNLIYLVLLHHNIISGTNGGRKFQQKTIIIGMKRKRLQQTFFPPQKWWCFLSPSKVAQMTTPDMYGTSMVLTEVAPAEATTAAIRRTLKTPCCWHLFSSLSLSNTFELTSLFFSLSDGHLFSSLSLSNRISSLLFVTRKFLSKIPLFTSYYMYYIMMTLSAKAQTRAASQQSSCGSKGLRPTNLRPLTVAPQVEIKEDFTSWFPFSMGAPEKGSFPEDGSVCCLPWKLGNLDHSGIFFLFSWRFLDSLTFGGAHWPFGGVLEVCLVFVWCLGYGFAKCVVMLFDVLWKLGVCGALEGWMKHVLWFCLLAKLGFSRDSKDSLSQNLKQQARKSL